MVDKITTDSFAENLFATEGEAAQGLIRGKMMDPFLVKAAITALGGGGGSGGGGSGPGLTFQFFTSGRSSGELTSSLPVGGAYRQIYRVGPISLLPTDLLIAFGEFEYTTDETSFNTMCMSNILLTTGATAISGVEVTDTNGRNVTPAMHHDTHTKIGAIMPGVTGNRWVTLTARADSSSGTKPLRVEQDYGHLDVIILRPTT